MSRTPAANRTEQPPAACCHYAQCSSWSPVREQPSRRADEEHEPANSDRPRARSRDQQHRERVQPGDIVNTIGDFNSPSVNGYPFATNPGIQLDLATRTGYMFAPADDQVQQFSY
jgi:hypothetical protein